MRRKQLKETQRTRGQEPTIPLYSPNAGFDDTLGYSLVPSQSHLCLSVWPLVGLQQPHRRARVNPWPCTQDIFVLDALPATTLTTSGLAD